jgi:NADH-quinone oxidoreductase subunit M
MMFTLVGVVYERAHHRDLNRFGGLGPQMPRYLGWPSSASLPRWACLDGRLHRRNHGLPWRVPVQPWLAALPRSHVADGGLHPLDDPARVLRRAEGDYSKFPDLNRWEMISLVPMGVVAIVFGVFPSLAIDIFKTSTRAS